MDSTLKSAGVRRKLEIVSQMAVFAASQGEESVITLCWHVDG